MASTDVLNVVWQYLPDQPGVGEADVLWGDQPDISPVGTELYISLPPTVGLHTVRAHYRYTDWPVMYDVVLVRAAPESSAWIITAIEEVVATDDPNGRW